MKTATKNVASAENTSDACPQGAPNSTAPILPPQGAYVNGPMPPILSLAHAPAARAIITDFEARKRARLASVLGPVNAAIRENWRELRACRTLAAMAGGADRDGWRKLADVHRRQLWHFLAVRRAAKRWGGAA